MRQDKKPSFCIDDHTIRLTGPLNFDTVPDLKQHLKKVLKEPYAWRLDLAEISQTDSAGLALLLDCLSFSKKKGRVTMTYINFPAQLKALLTTAGLTEIVIADDDSTRNS